MNKNVLVVNVEFPPIGGPGVQRIVKFVRYLPENGWCPIVICGDRSTWHKRRDEQLLKEVPPQTKVFRIRYRTPFEKPELIAELVAPLFRPLSVRWPHHEITAQLKRVAEFLFIYGHPEPMADWVSRALRKALECHKEFGFNVMVTSGPPHVSHLLGLALQKMRGIKWIADFRDPWSATASSIGCDRVGIARRMDQIWEHLVLRNADKAITLSPSWAKLLQRKRPHIKPVDVIQNGYDPNDIFHLADFQPVEGGEDSRLHIHYNGSIQCYFSPEILFRSLARLTQRRPEIKERILCTFTGLPEEFVRLSHTLGIEGLIHDTGPMLHSESIKYCMTADVLLLMLNHVGKISYGWIPAKIYEYVALGKPLLALIPKVGDVCEMLKNYSAAYIAQWNDEDEIEHCLLRLLEAKESGRLNRVAPPEWISQYSRQAETKQLAAILDSLS